jgi:hypothetical protein
MRPRAARPRLRGRGDSSKPRGAPSSGPRRSPRRAGPRRSGGARGGAGRAQLGGADVLGGHVDPEGALALVAHEVEGLRPPNRPGDGLAVPTALAGDDGSHVILLRKGPCGLDAAKTASPPEPLRARAPRLVVVATAPCTARRRRCIRRRFSVPGRPWATPPRRGRAASATPAACGP